MIDLLGIDSLFSEMILGVGLALVVGNLLAWWKHRRGQRPRDVEAGAEFRPARATFLATVGLVMAIWGGASTFA